MTHLIWSEIVINPHRSRWITWQWWYNDRFKQENTLEDAIKELAKNSTWPIQILEVWCGLWVTLLQLMKKGIDGELPDMRLHGINYEPRIDDKKSNPPVKMYWSDNFKDVAQHPALHMFDEKEIAAISQEKWPDVDFYDAGEKIKFEDNSLDLIISLITIPFIKRKDVFIDEVWRTLKVWWKAILHIDKGVTQEKQPTAPVFLRYATPRCMIKNKDGIVVSLASIFDKLCEKWYDISYKATKNYTVILTKNDKEPLDLQHTLAFIERDSFDLWTIHEENIKNGKDEPGEDEWYLWYRSVFQIK